MEPIASTGANSITAYSRGKYTIEFPDGTKHKVYPYILVVSGTLMGERTYSVINKSYIVDEKNDFISIFEFNADDRGSFAKMFTKNVKFPDYFKYVYYITLGELLQD